MLGIKGTGPGGDDNGVIFVNKKKDEHLGWLFDGFLKQVFTELLDQNLLLLIESGGLALVTRIDVDGFSYGIIRVKNSAGWTLETLTPRQASIAPLIARGYSTDEIAKELGLKLPTVSVQVGRMLKKFHAKNRPDFVKKLFLYHLTKRPLVLPKEPAKTGTRARARRSSQ